MVNTNTRRASGPRVGTLELAAAILIHGILTAQVSWQQMVVEPRPGHRGKAAIAYDEGRGRTVVFGGRGVSTWADTWEWDGTTWQQRFPLTSPAYPFQAKMVYDWVRNICVCYLASGTGVDQLWEYDGTNWYQRPTAFAPPARIEFALAFDRMRGRTVLYGGLDSNYYHHTDIWEWDGIRWTQHLPAVAPRARIGAALAFDPMRQRMLLFGGFHFIPPNQSVALSDTWEWDGTSWSQLNPPQSPPAGAVAFATTHLGLGRVLLFERISDTAPYLWEWDGTTWIRRTFPQAPPTRGSVTALPYDTARNRLVLFGGEGFGGLHGYSDDTWECDGATWTRRSLQPPPRYGHGMAYHSARQRVVLFGGYDARLYADTWEWDGGRWIERAPVQAPSARSMTALADHASRGELILYGGRRDSPLPLGDTWVWDGAAWHQRTPPTSPPPLEGHSLTYDQARDRTVLFGGSQGSGPMSETFEWDGSRWTQVLTGQRPPARDGHAAAYDAVRRRVVAFGGGTSRDTWEYDGTNWTQRFPAQSPPAVFDHRMTWDAARQRVVLFGYDSRTWEWDGTTWTARSPLIAPATRSGGGLAYDAARRRVVLFSGMDTGTYAWPDTWEYGPDFPAAWASFGTGCAGSAGMPVLGVPGGRLPWLGEALTVSVSPLPAPSLAVLFLGSRTSWGAIPLPLPLTSVGMPGCSLLASGTWALAARGIGGQAATVLPIPTDPGLLGASLHVQALVPDPGVNAAGVVASQGGTLLLGGR